MEQQHHARQGSHQPQTKWYQINGEMFESRYVTYSQLKVSLNIDGTHFNTRLYEEASRRKVDSKYE